VVRYDEDIGGVEGGGIDANKNLGGTWDGFVKYGLGECEPRVDHLG